MAGCCGLSAAGQDEFLESGEVFIEAIEVVFKPIDVRFCHCAVARDTQLAAQFEQVVLDFREAGANRIRYGVGSQYDADSAIGFIDCSVRLDPSRVLGDATAIAKTCGAVVTGARVDFAKSVSHWLILTPAVLEFDKAAALLHSIGQGSLVFLVEHVFDSRIELPVVANANLTR